MSYNPQRAVSVKGFVEGSGGLKMSEKLVDRFARGVEVAKKAGWDVRFANLGGTGGGWCRVAERSFVFVDLSLDVLEQLDRLEEALEMAVEDFGSDADVKEVRGWLAEV